MALAARDGEAVRNRLAEIVGQANVLGDQELASYSIGGDRPLAAVQPADEGEVAEVAGLANRERLPIVPWGGGSKQGIEPLQPTEGIVLGTSRMNTTLELDAANLTATVGAGRVVDDLRRELAEAGLFLPLDPMDSASSTLGGTLATNSSGSNRLLYRTARDLVLGLRVITPSGSAIRVGGKTVKDVAGYDLKKLYIGSWGTLGVITEATVRLLPQPETRATVVMVFPHLIGACAAVGALLSSYLRPSAADLLSSGALPVPAERELDLHSGPYLLMVSVEGAREATDRQRRELLELARRNGARAVASLQGDEEAKLWRQRKEMFARLPEDRPAMLVKGSVRLNRVLDFVTGLEGLRAEQGLEVNVAAHAGNGIVHGLLVAESGGPEALVTAAERLQRVASECGGFALVQRAPREVAAKVPLWPPRSDYGLMREIKSRLDPNNLWNPARTPGLAAGATHASPLYEGG